MFISEVLPDIAMGLPGHSPITVTIVFVESWITHKETKILWTHRTWGPWMDVMTLHTQRNLTLVQQSPTFWTSKGLWTTGW